MSQDASDSNVSSRGPKERWEDHFDNKCLLFDDFEDEGDEAEAIAKVLEEKVTSTTVDAPMALTTITKELVVAVSVLPMKEIEVTTSTVPPEAADSIGNATRHAPMDDKGKGAMKAKDPKMASKGNVPTGEGSLGQKDTEGVWYTIHHSTEKMMTVEQVAETRVFVKKLGYYPSWATNSGGGPNDYLYCCPYNLETDVCRYMMDNVSFPKLEARLSLMPFEDF